MPLTMIILYLTYWPALSLSPASKASELLVQYNEGLSSLLDVHAPVRKENVTIHPVNPWPPEGRGSLGSKKRESC